MNPKVSLLPLALSSLLLAACGGGGGGGSTPPQTMGTLGVSLTDAPACGFDAVNVTVSKVRVNTSATATDTDSGWTDLTLSPARKIAAVAEAAEVQLNCGGLAVQSQLEAAAAAHFYAATPQRRMMGAGEFVFGLNTVGPDPLVPRTDFVVRAGHVDVPTAPGLGIEIDEAALQRHTLRYEKVVR